MKIYCFIVYLAPWVEFALLLMDRVMTLELRVLFTFLGLLGVLRVVFTLVGLLGEEMVVLCPVLVWAPQSSSSLA